MYLVGLKVGPGVYAEAAAAVGVVAGDDGGREGVHKDLSGVHSSDIQPPPMQEKETPAGPWQQCSAEFKEPI